MAFGAATRDARARTAQPREAEHARRACRRASSSTTGRRRQPPGRACRSRCCCCRSSATSGSSRRPPSRSSTTRPPRSLHSRTHVAAGALREAAMSRRTARTAAGPLAGRGATRSLALGTPHARSPSGAELFHLGDAGRQPVPRRARPDRADAADAGARAARRTSWSRSGRRARRVGWSALIPPHRFTLKATAPLETEVLALPRDGAARALRRAPGRRLRRHAERRGGIGQRLQVFQAMWLREMQRVVELRCA